MTPQQEELARLARSAVDARFRSVYQASQRIPVDRHVLSRLLNDGRAPQLAVLERIARALGADVDLWRDLAGYPADAAGSELTGGADLPVTDEMARRIAESVVKQLRPENPLDRWEQHLQAFEKWCQSAGAPELAVFAKTGTDIPDVETADQMMRGALADHAHFYPDFGQRIRDWAHGAGLGDLPE